MQKELRLLGPFAEQGDDVFAFIIWDGDSQGSSIDDEAKLAAFIADFILKELVHVRLFAPQHQFIVVRTPMRPAMLQHMAHHMPRMLTAAKRLSSMCMW